MHANSEVPQSRKRPACFIELSPWPESRKKRYAPAEEVTLPTDMAFIEVDEVIGEYEDEDILYYFARYRHGIARKVRVRIYPGGFPLTYNFKVSRKAVCGDAS